MKKFVSFLLVVVFMLSLSVTALAAGSPVAPQPKTAEDSGIGIYNSDDRMIAFVPASKVVKVNVGQADKLSAEDKEAFLAAYEEAKKTEGKIVRRFFWIDVPEEYKTMEGFAYAKLNYGSYGQNVSVTVNGKDMENVRLGHGRYYAKITEFGIVSIVSD